jgi:hypothetical protein
VSGERGREDIPPRPPLRALAAAAALSLLAGCGGSGGIGEDETATYLRVLNLIGDSPSLQFVVDTTVIATSGFGGGTAYSVAPGGDHSTQLRAVRAGRLPGDTGATDPIALGAAVDRDFSDITDYTLIAAGTVASPQLFTIDAPEQRETVAETKLIWRMVHAVAGGQVVDVYLTAPEAGVATPQYIATLGFQDATETRELTLTRQPDADEDDALYVNMTFELRVSGTTQVLYNSGPQQLNERNRLLFAIAPNVAAPDGSPLQLAVLGSDGSGGLLRDPSDPATVRLAHLSHDTPALDLTRLGSPQQTLAQNIAFGGVSLRTATASGNLDLLTRLNADPAQIVFINEFSATRDQAYSVYAIGPQAALDGLVLIDDRRSVPTQARVRFVHAAGSLADDTVDVYLTLPGEAIDFNPDDDSDTTDDADRLRQVSGLGYRAGSGYVSLEGGSYDVYFAAAGATATLVGPVSLQLANGSVQTVAVTDSTMAALQVQAVTDTQD